MKEHSETWLMMFGLSVAISWVGALSVWAFPSFSTLIPVEFGLYFSAMSFAGCGFGWLAGLKGDC